MQLCKCSTLVWGENMLWFFFNALMSNSLIFFLLINIFFNYTRSVFNKRSNFELSISPQLICVIFFSPLFWLPGPTSLVWAGGQTCIRSGLWRRGTLSGSWPSKYTRAWNICLGWCGGRFKQNAESCCKKCLIMMREVNHMIACVCSRPWACICTGSWWFTRTPSSRLWLAAASHWSGKTWTNQHVEWWRKWSYSIGGKV